MDPPRAVVEGWTSLDDVCEWAELTGTESDMSTARGGFYRAMGCTGSQHYRFITTLTEADFEEFLTRSWTIAGVDSSGTATEAAPSLAARAAAEAAAPLPGY